MIKYHSILLIFLFCLISHIVKSQGTVRDVDGNTYRTVVIGDQEWMAENLRTSRYNDGTSLFTNLARHAWSITTEGAYSVYPHQGVEGINSEREMINAYGKLYNWYAVKDERGLCPDGWRVPTDGDWDELVNYLIIKFDITNEWEEIDAVGNVLKSCWQEESPLGGDCDRINHPRWFFSDIHYGIDKVDFSGLPAGGRYSEGTYNYIGKAGLWWSSTERSADFAWGRLLGYYHGGVYRYSGNKKIGFSVRCIKN